MGRCRHGLKSAAAHDGSTVARYPQADQRSAFMNDLLKLHPVRQNGMVMWQIDDLPVFVGRAPNSRVWSVFSRGDAYGWHLQVGLINARWATRAQAVRTVTAYVAQHPVPAERAVKLTRHPDGGYVTADGVFRVVRHEQGWRIARVGRPALTFPLTVSSLREAACLIASMSRRTSRDVTSA